MTSSPNPALTELHDIVLPDAVSTYPIAIGYWLLLIALTLLLIITFVQLKRWYSRTRAKKAALMELTQITSKTPNLAIEINSLLKRAALSYLPRQDIANLTGNNWSQFLIENGSKRQDEVDELISLLHHRYRCEPLDNTQAIRLLTLAQIWLKTALPLRESKLC